MGSRVTGLFVAPASGPAACSRVVVPVRHLQPDQHAALSAKAAGAVPGRDRGGRPSGRRAVAKCLSVEDEYPADTILRVAAKRKCDLIVMASHGRRGMAGVLLGSETQKVLLQAKMPVLVCR